MKKHDTFKRYELKYILTKSQRDALKVEMKSYMVEDAHGKNIISNIYYDTADYRLIRKSIEGPVYKEKLRTRQYISDQLQSDVFVELKKKYKGVVYKRRVALSSNDATQYLDDGHTNKIHNQVTDEIDYFMSFYKKLKPAMSIVYTRDAYFTIDDANIRMTFDENVMYRTDQLSHSKSQDGLQVTKDDQVILELKTSIGLPDWLRMFFSKHKIFQVPYSKCGEAYKMMTGQLIS